MPYIILIILSIFLGCIFHLHNEANLLNDQFCSRERPTSNILLSHTYDEECN